MGRDDGAEAKVAAAVALTAALFSPRVRGLARRGAVRGLAGALTAGEAIAAFARGVGRGIEDATGAARPAPSPGAIPDEPPAGAAVGTPAAPAGGAAVAGAGSRPPRRAGTPAPAPSAAPGTSANEEDTDA